MTNGAAYGGTYWDNGHCHVSPTFVMKIGKASIYAGRWVEMEKDLDWELRIRLNDGFGWSRNSVPLVDADKRAKRLLGIAVTDAMKYPPTVNIDWDDFGAPPLSKVWWQNLVRSIEAIPEESAIAIYCQGGHGRTGTALSILAGLSGQDMGNCRDVIDWVRTRYCEDAVESWTQVDYIAETLGLAQDDLNSYPTSYLKAQNSNKGYHTTFQNPSVVTKIDDKTKSSITPETTMFNPGNTVQSTTAKDVMVALAKRGSKRGKGKRKAH